MITEPLALSAAALCRQQANKKVAIIIKMEPVIFVKISDQEHPIQPEGILTTK